MPKKAPARRRAPRNRALGLTRKWAKLLREVPGYDAVSTAGACRFDVQAAEKALAFFPEMLVHVKGPSAGKPFNLERWQQAIIANLFGWKRPDGTRRYRVLFLYVPKKNGKSAMAAGLVLLVMAGESPDGGEIYSAACSREQATLIYQHAAGMVKKRKEFADRFRVYGDSGGAQSKSIVWEERRIFYRPLAADTHRVDGVNPVLVLIDELHRHQKPELADVLHKSTAMQDEPITAYLTTADYDRPSVCNETLGYARQVRDGVVDDPAFLPVIYEAPKGSDKGGRWKRPEVWRQANPNLNVTVKEEFLAREVRKCDARPSLLNNFLRLHLNVVTAQTEHWLDMGAWDKCAGTNDPVAWRQTQLAALRGRECIGGLDLGAVGDLSALVLLFESLDDPKKVLLLPWFWMPHDGLERKDPQHAGLYTTWAREGFLNFTDGNVTDYDVLRRQISGVDETGHAHGDGLADCYGLRELAIDRGFQGNQLAINLQKDGTTVVAFPQGMLSMAEPTKEFEARVLGGGLEHGGNPVLRWMAANAQVKQDEHNNKKPVKPTKDSQSRVDGIVAAVMAFGRWNVEREQTASVYETRGLVVLGGGA